MQNKEVSALYFLCSPPWDISELTKRENELGRVVTLVDSQRCCGIECRDPQAIKLEVVGIKTVGWPAGEHGKHCDAAETAKAVVLPRRRSMTDMGGVNDRDPEAARHSNREGRKEESVRWPILLEREGELGVRRGMACSGW